MSHEIKERPILFSAPMVRANRAGLKNMTRRVVKPQPEWTFGCFYPRKGHKKAIKFKDEADFRANMPKLFCPYGKPGDRLWVRETLENDGDGDWKYAADASYLPMEYAVGWQDKQFPKRSIPSIHLPRWACRDVYPVVSVRVERLHDITEADAIAEGVEVVAIRDGKTYYRNYMANNDTSGPLVMPTIVAESAVDSYKSLWEKINGIESWWANPWLWVIGYDNPMWKGGAA